MAKNGYPGRNGQVLRIVQPSKTEPGRNKKFMNNPITNTEIEAVIKNVSKTEAQGQMASQQNPIKHLEKSYCLFSKTLSKICR